jgi:O-glycosyl hydrolase
MQAYEYNLYADIDFENGTSKDALNHVTATMLNNAAIVPDAERGGKVLQFSAYSKGCLKIEDYPLPDTVSLSFWGKREDDHPLGLWRMFFAWYAGNGSNIYLTPLTSWGDNSYLIMDHKPYSSYKSFAGTKIDNNRWYHFAVVYCNNYIKYYVDGILQTETRILFRLSDFKFSKFFFGCNPELNYPMNGRIDHIKIFNYPLCNNQVKALSEDHKIPAPETAGEVTTPPITLHVKTDVTYQTIRNFGASDGWNAQTAGLYFPESKKDAIAELLFSLDTLPDGTPKGIGLSAWRFNIGAGTAEQGEASRIAHFSRRTECFLNPDGKTYNWSKQAGQQWFLRKAAKQYHVEDIIGWQNSPPVYFTVRGLGFREFGDEKKTILKKEYYADFGNFLANVINHFKEKEDIRFKYASPLNEPQWNWDVTVPGAPAQQEGTPWTNREIADVVKAINTAFVENNVTAKLFITEAGSMSYLLNESSGDYGHQLSAFWNKSSPLTLHGLPSFSNIVSSHSYWTDASPADIVANRNKLRDQMKSLNTADLEYWQTEYCLLGNGYKQGFDSSSSGSLTPMECAIAMARIIHNDLTAGNAAAWQWWTTFDFDSKAGPEDRYALIRFELNETYDDGVYCDTKLLYALGNYSHFVRPGMKRVLIERDDHMNDTEAVFNQMFSAFYGNETIVIVAINASAQPVAIRINNPVVQNGLRVETFTPYVTSGNIPDNIKRYPDIVSERDFVVPATSIVTFRGKIRDNNSESNLPPASRTNLMIYPNPVTDCLTVVSPAIIRFPDVYGADGKKVMKIAVNEQKHTFPVRMLDNGTYVVRTDNQESMIFIKK